MKPFRSIGWRLQFWYAILLTGVSVAFAITAYTGERELINRSTDSELDRRIASITRIFRAPPPGRGPQRRPPDPDDPMPPPPPQDDGQGNPRPRPARLPLVEEASYGDEWYYYFEEDGQHGERTSANFPEGFQKPVAPAQSARGPGHRAWGVYREAFVRIPTGQIVLVGRIMTTEWRRLRIAGAILGCIGAALLVLGLVIGRLLVRSALRPIGDISRTASKIAEGDLSQRIDAGKTENELGQLVHTLNTTFARLESSFAQQARFTSDAAHELRTPVSVLLTQTQSALGSDSLTGEAREALAACLRSAQRMRAIIDSLLLLARHDANEASGERAVVDLSARATEVATDLDPLARQKSIVIESHLEPALIRGDATQIDRVLVNLITNALVHQPAGGRVRIDLSRKEGLVVLAVSDTGPGIDPRHLPKLFERFYRADASRTRESGGTGLGLAIVKAIVEGHGGTVSAGNLPGKGAIFTVQLPGIGSA